MFDAISSFDQLDNLSIKYADLYGIEPFNLSFWNPSNEFSNKMFPYINLEFSPKVLDYIFTYEIEDLKNRLLMSFGFDPSQKDGILTSNGTTSIMMAVHWIKMRKYNRLNVVCPSYFSLINNCQKEGIELVKYCMNYQTGQINDIIPQNFENEVFWLTNPFYSLGYHITGNNVELIETLLNKNIVIVDDCVAQKGKELSRFFGNHPNFMGIYAPHKSICFNGVKFSILVFNKDDEPFFDQSVDFLCGGLNVASLAAINNYLDGNYDLYRQIFQKNISETHQFIKKLCSGIDKAFYNNEDQHYLTGICFPNIPYELSENNEFLWRIMDNTGAAFIPGILNNYPKESGFSFRVNMARDSNLFRATITRLLFFLKNNNF